MERVVGTVVRGLRCPIIKEGDSIENIVVESVLKASETEGFTINDKDVRDAYVRDTIRRNGDAVR